MTKITVSTKKHGKVVLDDSHYLAAGGEGTIYVKGNEAFKIYHDSNKMLPISKIQELSVLKTISCIVIPDEIIYDTNGLPLGYTMKYLKDSEFFCKIFTKSFKDANNISISDVGDLVDYMQKTMIDIHSKGIIVGDYNEMNFMLDNGFKIPYHIDVDSWQTPSFKCTAIMETVQDYTTKLGHFDENTDWYSWAVVTFQMFIGIHPYKGRHPNYKPKELKRRALDKISVFHSGVQIPNMCSDISVIPKVLRDWYKEVFEQGFRGLPPSINGIKIFATAPVKTVTGNNLFDVQLYYDVKENIIRVFNFKEELYVLVNDGYYDFKTKTKVDSVGIIGLCEVLNEDPVIIKKDSSYIYFYSKDIEIGKVAYEHGFFANGSFYTVLNCKLVEHRIIKMKNLMVISKAVDSVHPFAYKTHDGFVSQDIVGKISFVIPYAYGTSRSIRLPELDGYTIITGKYESRTCVVLALKNNVYDRYLFTFSKDFTSYTIRKDEDVGIGDVNFTVLPNGIVTNIIGDERMELFMSVNTQTKAIDNPPCDSTNKLYSHYGKIIYVDGNKIKKCSLIK